MNTYAKILLIILFFSMLFSCYKIEEYPPEPEIEYKSFVLRDTIDANDNIMLSGKLTFSFVDGDGDIGSKETSDTSKTEENKALFIDILVKDSSGFVEKDLEIPYDYTLPYFEAEASNPTLKGDISVSDITFYPPFKKDTIKLRFYIEDRDGHKSNTEETEIFVLSNYINSAK